MLERILFFGKTVSSQSLSPPRDIRGWSSPSAFLRTVHPASGYVYRRGNRLVKYWPLLLLLLSPSFWRCLSRILDRNSLILRLLHSRGFLMVMFHLDPLASKARQQLPRSVKGTKSSSKMTWVMVSNGRGISLRGSE